MFSCSNLAPKGIALEFHAEAGQVRDKDPVVHGLAHLGPHFLKLPSLFRAL